MGRPRTGGRQVLLISLGSTPQQSPVTPPIGFLAAAAAAAAADGTLPPSVDAMKAAWRTACVRYHPDKLAPRLARAGAPHGDLAADPAALAVLARAAAIVAAASAEWEAWRARGGGGGATG